MRCATFTQAMNDYAVPKVSNTRRWIEIAAVAATGLGKFLFMDVLNWKFPFIIAAILSWIIYIVIRARSVKGILSHWGFRTHNFKSVVLKILPFGIIGFLGCVVTGYFLGTINVTWHILPLLLIYPIWGVIQHFLMIALVAGNLQDMEGKKISTLSIVFITALLFAGIHYPWYWLILGTFLLALLYTFIYLKNRNLYVLGLFHGWLGALFFYTIVDRDPFLEVFGTFLN